MPLDGYTNKAREDALATSIVARLELLQEIAAKTEGSQGSYRTCLYSEVRKHPLLQDIPELHAEWPHGNSPPLDRYAAAHWFGLSSDIWGGTSIESKRDYIETALWYEQKWVDICEKV